MTEDATRTDDRQGVGGGGAGRKRTEGTAAPPPGGGAGGPGRRLLRIGGQRRFGWREWLMVLGPGLVAANAGNDAGGIATYASAGAEFVYSTLFVMVLLTVGLVVVQEMVARLASHTGKGLGALMREELPLRTTGFALSCLFVANAGLVVSEFAGLAAAFELFGVPRYVVVPIAAVAIWSLVLFGNYKYAERGLLILALAFVAYPIAAVLAQPDWSAVATNAFWPHFDWSKEYLLLVVALIGTTITPYMQFYGAGAVADKGGGPDTYRLARVDAVTGSIAACLVSCFIIIATAAAIGGSGSLSSAAEAAQALEPVAGRFAQQLFAIGLIGASALAAVVVPLSTAYGISEAVGVERSVSRTFREAPVFLGLFTGQIVIGAAVSLLPGNLIDLLIGTQVLNGVITPIILSFILVLANRRSVLGDAANGAGTRLVGAVIVTVVGTLSLVVVGQTLLGLT